MYSVWSPVVSSLVALGCFVFPPFGGFFFWVCFGSECSNVLLMGCTCSIGLFWICWVLV